MNYSKIKTSKFARHLGAKHPQARRICCAVYEKFSQAAFGMQAFVPFGVRRWRYEQTS